MMQIIGVKRILVLVMLIAVNAAMAAGIYAYIAPESVKLQMELNGVRGQIGEKRAEVDRLRNEYELIQQQKTDFENLRAAGFLSDQNRLVVRRRITEIQQYSRVLKAEYDLSAATVERTDKATEIGYAILNTPVRVEIDALDDLDFFSFVYWMENAFPGHNGLQSLYIERDGNVDENTLRAVGSGSPPVLINGRVEFSWRTMLPEAQVVSATDAFGAGGL